MHPRLESLVMDQNLSELSYEDLMKKIQEIRNGRIQPEKKKVVRRKSTERVRKHKTENLLDSLSPEQKKILMAKLKERKDAND